MKIEITIDDVMALDRRCRRTDKILIGDKAKNKEERRLSYDKVMREPAWKKADIGMILRVEEDEFFGWVLLRRSDIGD